MISSVQENTFYNKRTHSIVRVVVEGVFDILSTCTQTYTPTHTYIHVHTHIDYVCMYMYIKKQKQTSGAGTDGTPGDGVGSVLGGDGVQELGARRHAHLVDVAQQLPCHSQTLCMMM